MSPRGTLRRGAIVVACLFILSCARGAPARPSSVPSDSAWAGGVDGGVWVLCLLRTKEPTFVYECTLYSHPSGKPDALGLFVLADPPRQPGHPYSPLPGGLPPSFDPAPTYWDGNVLH